VGFTGSQGFSGVGLDYASRSFKKNNLCDVLRKKQNDIFKFCIYSKKIRLFLKEKFLLS